MARTFVGTKNPSAVLMSRIRITCANDLTRCSPQCSTQLQLPVRKQSPTVTTLEPPLSNFLNPEKCGHLFSPEAQRSAQASHAFILISDVASDTSREVSASSHVDWGSSSRSVSQTPTTAPMLSHELEVNHTASAPHHHKRNYLRRQHHDAKPNHVRRQCRENVAFQQQPLI